MTIDFIYSDILISKSKFNVCNKKKYIYMFILYLPNLYKEVIELYIAYIGNMHNICIAACE